MGTLLMGPNEARRRSPYTDIPGYRIRSGRRSGGELYPHRRVSAILERRYIELALTGIKYLAVGARDWPRFPATGMR